MELCRKKELKPSIHANLTKGSIIMQIYASMIIINASITLINAGITLINAGII